MVYVFRGLEFHSLISLERYFCLKAGAGKRMLENKEITIRGDR